MKALFIVQRYGVEVDGGAELYCRWLAEKFSRSNSVTILTTTARDYITWANYYEPGRSFINNVEIIRMPVELTRDIHSFNKMTAELLNSPTNKTLQDEWLKAQGPWSPMLLQYLEDHHSEFDVLIFFTYLYAPTVLGTAIAPEKSILIPTAHDEPVARLAIFKELYARVSGIAYLTNQERQFVESAYAVQNKPGILLGTGVELPASNFTVTDVLKKYRLSQPFLFYMGRIEAGKGCNDLIRYFQAFREKYANNITLILAGREHMPLPDDPFIKYIGFVPDEDIVPLLEASAIVMVPSAFESLSILLLQAFACQRPIVANASSSVLLAHCRQSNAGLYYADEEEFIEILRFLLSDAALRKQMGDNGLAYINRLYTWDSVTLRLLEICRLVHQSS